VLYADGSVGAMLSRGVSKGELCTCRGGIGTVEPKLQCCEFAEMFFVFGSEMLLKCNQGLICHRLDTPHVTGHGEYACCCKHEEC